MRSEFITLPSITMTSYGYSLGPTTAPHSCANYGWRKILVAPESIKVKAATPLSQPLKLDVPLNQGWHAGSKDPIRVLRKIYGILEKTLRYHDDWLRLQCNATPTEVIARTSFMVDWLVVSHESPLLILLQLFARWRPGTKLPRSVSDLSFSQEITLFFFYR